MHENYSDAGREGERETHFEINAQQKMDGRLRQGTVIW